MLITIYVNVNVSYGQNYKHTGIYIGQHALHAIHS